MMTVIQRRSCIHSWNLVFVLLSTCTIQDHPLPFILALYKVTDGFFNCNRVKPVKYYMGKCLAVPHNFIFYCSLSHFGSELPAKKKKYHNIFFFSLKDLPDKYKVRFALSLTVHSWKLQRSYVVNHKVLHKNKGHLVPVSKPFWFYFLSFYFELHGACHAATFCLCSV